MVWQKKNPVNCLFVFEILYAHIKLDQLLMWSRKMSLNNATNLKITSKVLGKILFLEIFLLQKSDHYSPQNYSIQFAYRLWYQVHFTMYLSSSATMCHQKSFYETMTSFLRIGQNEDGASSIQFKHRTTFTIKICRYASFALHPGMKDVNAKPENLWKMQLTFEYKSVFEGC